MNDRLGRVELSRGEYARLVSQRRPLPPRIIIEDDLVLSHSPADDLGVNILVAGWVELDDCPNLVSLPPFLKARGIYIERAPVFEHLPEIACHISELNVNDCPKFRSVSAVNGIADWITTDDSVYLDPIPSNFTVGSIFNISEILVTPTEIEISHPVAETLLSSANGRKLREVIDLDVFVNHPIMDAKVTAIRSHNEDKRTFSINGDWTSLCVDGSRTAEWLKWGQVF